MLNISRHPLLTAIYEAALAVEACGATPELTAAVTKVSALLTQADALLDTIPAETGFPCEIEVADFDADTVLLKMTGDFSVMAGAHVLSRVRHQAAERLRDGREWNEVPA